MDDMNTTPAEDTAAATVENTEETTETTDEVVAEATGEETTGTEEEAASPMSQPEGSTDSAN